MRRSGARRTQAATRRRVIASTLAIIALMCVSSGSDPLTRQLATAAMASAAAVTPVLSVSGHRDTLRPPSSAPSLDANPVRPLPQAPLGTDIDLEGLPVPPTPARVRLGRWLFYDKRLSRDHGMSCATCHVPEKAFSVDRAKGIGANGQRTRRKPPALLNLAGALRPWMFRDGRAPSLEDQILQPITDPAEMGNTLEHLLATLGEIPGYRTHFAEAFGSGNITIGRIAHAIADYERTRFSGNSPWDRWRRQRDESAVSNEVKRGHALFFGRAGCNQCHLGSNFTDSAFHNIGVGWDESTEHFSDAGRFEVTRRSVDRGAFKTPTLREVGRHPPYMHDGSVATLRDVVVIYNRGGYENPFLDQRLRPLNLSEQEMDDLVAFLGALDGEGYADAAPRTFPQ